MNEAGVFILATICGLFLFVAGVMVGENQAMNQLKQPIQAEQCLSVCAEQFEKWGC